MTVAPSIDPACFPPVLVRRRGAPPACPTSTIGSISQFESRDGVVEAVVIRLERLASRWRATAINVAVAVVAADLLGAQQHSRRHLRTDLPTTRRTRAIRVTLETLVQRTYDRLGVMTCERWCL